MEELVREVAYSLALAPRLERINREALQLAHPQNTGLAVYQGVRSSVDSYRRAFARS